MSEFVQTIKMLINPFLVLIQNKGNYTYFLSTYWAMYFEYLSSFLLSNQLYSRKIKCGLLTFNLLLKIKKWSAFYLTICHCNKFYKHQTTHEIIIFPKVLRLFRYVVPKYKTCRCIWYSKTSSKVVIITK